MQTSRDGETVAGTAEELGKRLSPVPTSPMIGGACRDLLFSGAGRRGGGVLTDGGTTHDADEEALDALLAEWSSGRSLRRRIANLTDGGRRRLNGDNFLDADTPTADGAEDLVVGDGRRDGFLPTPEDRVVDVNPRP